MRVCDKSTQKLKIYPTSTSQAFLCTKKELCIFSNCVFFVQPVLVELIRVLFPYETYQSQHHCLCVCNQWAYAGNRANAVDRLLILLIGWTQRIIGILFSKMQANPIRALDVNHKIYFERPRQSTQHSNLRSLALRNCQAPVYTKYKVV